AGAYSPNAADLNGDGTVDLLAVSCLADWSDPNSVSMMAWLNDGWENFTPVVLARRPIQLVSAAVGDLDGDNIPEIVTGAFHALPPFEETSNITLWRRK
ncbi:MAG TPA: VCBS repeat-containing protein, partial [Opitutus sp.]|nr:VCBS repeat-containing protein [Opitutus sp.]